MAETRSRKGVTSGSGGGTKKAAAIHEYSKAVTLFGLGIKKASLDSGADPAARIMRAPKGRRTLTARQIAAAIDKVFAARAKADG